MARRVDSRAHDAAVAAKAAGERRKKAQDKVNSLVDAGTMFNPTTLNSESLDRATRNLQATGSLKAQIVGSRGVTSASAPAPGVKKKRDF